MSEIVVEVKDLTKSFNGTVAVDRLSFEVRRGEILGLLGANGAGKTTAMHMILGLITPSSGSVRIFGKDFQKHRIEILQRSNFSSAYANLPTNLRVWQNMYVFSKIYGVKNHKAKVNQLLEMFEISHLTKRVTGQLSSGEATRLNLCKALLNDPELLMLDEPTASLDPDISDKVRKLLRSIQREKGMTVLYTSHNMRDIEEVCDRVLFVAKGKKIAIGTSREITEQFKQKSLEDVFIRIARSGDLLAEGEKERE
ncbi:MAG: ABC transporter ATP-binding protein [Verrucomicrobiae bacterium]|nr:ABC transporter ATP-binding protein [Verrucomicrobiae bacterium]